MDDLLKSYRKKRDFAVTGEPEGAPAPKKKGDALRFCVQRHAARREHFDLRLELGGVALSWAVPKGPSFSSSDKRLAVRVEDHPVEYMDFEGTIPAGEYGGGTVMLWDEGHWIPRTDPVRGLKEGSLKFKLNGKRLKGDWALVRIRPKGEEDAWLLIKERDEYSKQSAGISKFTRGVRSKKSMAEIAKGKERNPFHGASVMLADLCEALPSDMGWLFELKYDGYRMLGYVQGGRAVLKSRNGADCTKRFPAAAAALEELLGERAAVVDGEMVVAGEDGVPDFSALQSYAAAGRGKGLSYVLFDLLALDGEDLRARPLSERKARLKALLCGAKPPLSYSEHTEKITKKQLAALEARGIEGVVAKRADSAYAAGKNGDWRKLKFRNSDEFVIGGYTVREGKLRSLLVGYFEEGALRFAGSVGTGFTETARRALFEQLSALRRETSPFLSAPKRCPADAVWVQPALVAQVEYAEMTPSKLLRQASFKGLREDKPARCVGREQPRTEASADFFGVAITHPEKPMFPADGITKLDLARYYAAVSARMLPYVKDRRLSLVCCPAGIGGEQFFRRRFDAEQVAGVRQDGEGFCVTSAKGLLSLVQYNAVEFHIHGGKKTPDLMVFDLDPDEGLPLSAVRRGARDVKRVLDGLGLRSFLKTSGGKGYHIVVPLRGGTDWDAVRDFSKSVAILLEQTDPNRYTSSISKQARKGKIFLDWQRNGQGATSVAPYSVRAREGAAVSMPIAWEELGRVAPNGIDVRAALRRLEKEDPWADFFTVKPSQRLKPATPPRPRNQKSVQTQS